MNNTDRALCKANMDRAARSLAEYEGHLSDHDLDDAGRSFLTRQCAFLRSYIAAGREALLGYGI